MGKKQKGFNIGRRDFIKKGAAIGRMKTNLKELRKDTTPYRQRSRDTLPLVQSEG